jgi:BirA family biotin operon repressor/biotin-[acetyl-CoA-carboxylase] ligase
MKNMIRIKWFPELDSTNNELLRHIRDYDNLSVAAAVSQTAGRGQRGNRWLSAPGDNLTFSLLLKPADFPAKDIIAVTCLATVAVRNKLREEGVRAVIKWPNDIYAGNRKICGMLVENGLEGNALAWSVVGIGLNLNQTDFPAELVNPTSVKRLTGKTYDPPAFLESLCRRLETLLPELETPEGRNWLRKEYAKDLFQKDLSASYRDLLSGEQFPGIIRGITREGLLRVKTDGGERTFGFKEIGYIL